MLESLLLIGSNNTNNIIDQMIKPLKQKKGKKDDVMMKIIFDTDKKKVCFDYIKLDEQVAREYRWIGKTFSAAREPVARLTLDDIKYLYNEEKKRKESVVNNIRELIKNMPKSEGLRELDRLLEQIEQFDLGDVMSKVKNEIESKKKEFNVELFTISIKKNGNTIDLAKEKFYDEFLSLYMRYPNPMIDGVCHLCGKEKVLADPAFESGSMLKIYNKDKKGFISGISGKEEDMKRTFAICPECRLQLIAGEKYIARNLNFPLGNVINVFVIPRIGKRHEQPLLDRLASAVKAVTVYDGLEELDKFGKDIEELYEQWYSFTIIFGTKNQASFKLDYFLQEVPITNLRRIRDTVRDVMNEATRFWNTEERIWDLTLSGVAIFYPLRRRGDDFERRPLIELVSSILKLEEYDQNRLLEVGCLLAKIHRYELYSIYNIKQPSDSDIEMSFAIVKFNYLLLLLSRLGMLKSMTMEKNYDDLQIPNERISAWVKTMNYDILQTGLFMLGYLIAQVGNEQYKRNDKKKSILDKLDFKGMKREKIITLINEMPHHLRNYRILEYNEGYYHAMINAINRHMNDLDRDPIGNLFYILSGYAFGTYSAIMGGGKDEQ